MSREDRRGFTLVELLIVVAIIGILAMVAVPNLLTALQRSKQKRTMVNIRNIATAWEARATDFARYSAAGAGLPGAVSSPLPITDLSAMLVPTYIKNMQIQDGWGYTMQTFLDIPPSSGTTAQRYCIVSPGRDGDFADPAALGGFTNFDCDIIYSNGQFSTYPLAATTQ